MDKRGIFEMAIIFSIMAGCGAVVLDKGQTEGARAGAFAIISCLIGVVSPSPITGAMARKKKMDEGEGEGEEEEGS